MKKIFIILIIISVCTTCYNTAHSQPYRYPVMPGDSLWKNEKSYVDKVKLCNIPDSFLTSMSTDDLIISIFQFPYIQNLLLFDNFILGYDSLAAKFNGLAELENRTDTYQKIYDRYTSNTLNNNIAQDILLEYLLALDFNMDEFSTSQRNILLDSCLSKLEERIESDNFLVPKSTVSSSFLMIRLLSYLDPTLYSSIINDNQEIDDFKQTSIRPENSTINSIIYEAVIYSY